MPANSQSTKAEAAAEPGLALAVSDPATESTTQARPAPNSATDTTAMTAQFNSDRTRHSEPNYHVISSVPASLPNTAAPSQITTSQQNAAFTLAQSHVSSMKPGAFPTYSTSPNGSTVDTRALGVVACSFPCTYCGYKGHSHEMCRKQKREVGCLNCGTKGHLEHQCSQTSRSQCRYCLQKGHSDANCFRLKNDMSQYTYQCTYCSKYGHAENQCYKKSIDHTSRAHHTNTVPSACDSPRGMPGPNRSSELSMKSMVAPEKIKSRLSNFMRDTAADIGNTSHGHRVPITQAGKAAISIQDTPAKTDHKAEPGRFQLPHPTSHALPAKCILAPIDGAKPNVLTAKKHNSNLSQEPTSGDRAAHCHDGQGAHGDRYKQDETVALPISEFVAYESTSKRENSKLEPRGERGASTTTRRREKSANSSPTIYVFQDAICNRRVQQPVTTDNPGVFEFQRKLMKERREEAIRLRRVQNHVDF